jgi:hypothetical protein
MNCAACTEKRLHSEEEWENHPHRGHGFTREQGWSLPELAPSSTFIAWAANLIDEPIHPLIQAQIDGANQAMANLAVLGKEADVHYQSV